VTGKAFHLIGNMGLVREGNGLWHGRRSPKGERCRGNQQNQDNRAQHVFAHLFRLWSGSDQTGSNHHTNNGLAENAEVYLALRSNV
jgi:hypothetical protein